MNELQAVLNLIASALLGDQAAFLSPRLILSEEDTASTDGRTWVRLPGEFLGFRMSENMQLFIGLLAHEIGHWLQPLKAILTVEEQTGLNHEIVNLLLDVHLEHQVPAIFPLFAEPLRTVRETVRDARKASFEKGFREAADFLEAAGKALLYGRFCLQCGQPFSPPNKLVLNKSTRNPQVDADRLKELFGRVVEVAAISGANLPAYFQQLAADFPELCRPNQALESLNPLGMLQSGGDGLEMVRAILQDLKIEPGASTAEIISAAPGGSCPVSAETAALSKQLKKRWEAAPNSGVVMAPGKLNRLSAVRGDPMPFTMPAPIRGKQFPQMKIVLVVDWSGSMSVDGGAPWKAALQAAQAISLAVRNNCGDVRAALFAEHLWHAPDFTPEMLFASWLGPVSLNMADGDDTNFMWLPHLWQTFPAHRILLLTDGNGHPPGAVLPSQRKRTSVVLLQVHRNAPANVAEIEDTMRTIASGFVHVDRLSDLAAAWATLIPRRFQ